MGTKNQTFFICHSYKLLIVKNRFCASSGQSIFIFNIKLLWKSNLCLLFSCNISLKVLLTFLESKFLILEIIIIALTGKLVAIHHY